jgi:hypothetical protein
MIEFVSGSRSPELASKSYSNAVLQPRMRVKFGLLGTSER